MSGINKYSFNRWILGVALVVTCGIAVAGPVTDPAVPYVDGDALNASKMNSIRNAVNDNDTRITALQNGTPTCGTNMTRVGPICVDNFLARATIGSCSADGSTNCGTVVAVSQNTGVAAPDFSWAQAVRACVNAGKRLPTPGEWMAAFISGALSDETIDILEFVDSTVTLSSTNPATDPSSPGAASPAQGGYMGRRAVASNKVQMVNNVDYDAVDADGVTNFLFFRCVR